jgi:hypothetical protein
MIRMTFSYVARRATCEKKLALKRKARTIQDVTSLEPLGIHSRRLSHATQTRVCSQAFYKFVQSLLA